MAKKMGFNEPPLKRTKFGNISVTAILNGRTCKFKSKLEYRWAQYLNILQEAGEIKDFFYEFHTFHFHDNKAPAEYTPDFLVRNNDNSFEYYECKGMLSGYDIKKLKAVFDERPEVKITIVFWQRPRISVQKKDKLERFCDRVICNAKDMLKNLPIDMG